jgi:hypothetical protein
VGPKIHRLSLDVSWLLPNAGKPELRHLRYFTAVAEHLNYSEASRRIHVAQPAISQTILDLEEYLGEIGQLRIGFFGAAMAAFLPGLVQEYHRTLVGQSLNARQWNWSFTAPEPRRRLPEHWGSANTV